MFIYQSFSKFYVIQKRKLIMRRSMPINTNLIVTYIFVNTALKVFTMFQIKIDSKKSPKR